MTNPLISRLACTTLFVCLATTALAQNAQTTSDDDDAANIEATLTELKNRIEQLEFRLGTSEPSSFRSRVAKYQND